MSDIPKNQAQFFSQPYPSAPCDIYACTNRAKYFIGRPDGPLNICLRLCPEHAAQLVANLPEELMQKQAANEIGKTNDGYIFITYAKAMEALELLPDGEIKDRLAWSVEELKKDIDKGVINPQQDLDDKEALVSLFAETYATLDDEAKAELLVAISGIVEADEQNDDNQDPTALFNQVVGATDTAKGMEPRAEPKKYHCEYCGEGFDVPIGKANHLRTCPAKKEAEAKEGGDG